MKVDLTVEVYAIAVGVEGGTGVGRIFHNLEVITETDHLYLPITANVMTAHDYDNICNSTTNSSGKSHGVKLVSSKPPAGQGIIRPRRDQPINI